MRAYRFGDMVLDVPTIVGQMDQTIWALKSAWEQLNSKWVLMASSQLAQATDARLASLKGIINDLDVGGVARQHVFFPLDGQSSDQAWATYNETAAYVRQGLQDLGGFISTWALVPTLARVGSDVKQELKTDLTPVLLVVGGVLALALLGSVGNARRAFSGYHRRRRARR